MSIQGPIQLPCHCASLRQATRAITQLYDRALRPVGITSTQFSLLELIHSAPDIRTGEVASTLAMDSTTVTRSLKHLEDAGWIQFVEGLDLREKRWTLTRKGRTKLTAAKPHWQLAQDQVTKAIGSEEGRRLQALSFKLVQVLTA
jgi:DNA-binding MarR family transcriptional regulator